MNSCMHLAQGMTRAEAMRIVYGERVQPECLVQAALFVLAELSKRGEET